MYVLLNEKIIFNKHLISLQNARLVGDLVGLRPGRDKIRLQMEDGPRGIKVLNAFFLINN